MGNLKMNNQVLIITGSDGATAQGLIRYFADKYTHVIGFSRQQKTSYQEPTVETIKVDMLNPHQIHSAIDMIIEKYGERQFRMYRELGILHYEISQIYASRSGEEYNNQPSTTCSHRYY